MMDPYRMILINIVSVILLIGLICTYKYIFPKKTPPLLPLLIIISCLPLISLLRKGTYESGDLTLHAVFLQSFFESLKEGIIIPQWAGGLCGGYGCPVYIFEYVLPYYVGSIFHALGFSYIASTKLMLASGFIISGIGMYLWVKDHFGKIAGFVAGLFFLYAPYHLMDMHFRVSVGEVLSFAPMPYLFLWGKKIVETEKKRYIVYFAVTFVLLLLSHTSTTAILLPMVFIYTLTIWIRDKKRNIKKVIHFITALILGLLLSAYYWIPALLEVQYTWYSKGFEISDFKPFFEYIYSPVLFGFLFQGHQGELRLIIGYVQIFIVIFSCFLLYKKTIKNNDKPLLLLFLFFFFILFLLLQSFSKPVWLHTPLLSTFILPWRLLVPIALITAFIGGIVVKNYKNKTFIIILCLATILSTILNWGNRKTIPEDPNAYNTHWSLYTEYFEPNNTFYENQHASRVKLIPDLVLDRAPTNIGVLSGEAEIKELTRTTTRHTYILSAGTDVVIKENTFYFPGWVVTANKKTIAINYKNTNKIGVIIFTLPKGLYAVTVEFVDTPIRKVSKIMSSVTGGVLIFYILFQLIFKKRQFNSPKVLSKDLL